VKKLIQVKDKEGTKWHVEEWICRFAEEYGWTSGILDKDMAIAIEKGRKDPDDPWNFSQELGKSLGIARVTAFIRGELPEDEYVRQKGYGIDTLRYPVKEYRFEATVGISGTALVEHGQDIKEQIKGEIEEDMENLVDSSLAIGKIHFIKVAEFKEIGKLPKG